MTTRRRLALRPQAGQAPPDWYRIGPVLALAEDGQPTADEETATSSSADVYVYSTIGGWFGMTADDFVRDVAGLDVDQLVVHLNSPGGSADEGVTIANVLRAHRATVVIRVDGIAASAASAIAMAGDEVVMGIGSQLMIHDAWSYAVGDAAEMEKAARMLDSTSNALAQAYASKAGGTAAEWRTAMRAESWYAPEEAVAAGLADRVATADETGTAQGEQITPGSSLGGFWDMWDSLSAPDRHDLSAYRYAGRQHSPAPPMPGRTTPAASAAGTRQQEGSPVPFTPEHLKTMRQALGLADTADEPTIVAALTEALEERADPATAPVAGALPPGTVAVDAEQLAQLRAAAQRGDDARAQQELEGRQRAVDAAISDGRIPPARREAWLTQLAADPGAADTLAALAPGLVPVGGPVGHNAPGAVDTDGDAPAASVQSGADLYHSRYGKKD